MRLSRRLRRSLVISAAVLPLTVSLVALPAAAETEKQPTPAQAPVYAAPDLRAGEELPGMRSRSSRTVVSPEGGYETTVSAGPVNYRDADGAWQPIDTALVPDGKGGFANKAGDFRVELPGNLSAGRVTLGAGPRWVSFALKGAKPSAGKVDGSTITYPEVLPGVSVSYTVTAEGVAEYFTLTNPQATPTFDFDLKTSPGLIPKAAGNAVVVTDGLGTPAFTLPAAFAQDPADATTGHTAVATAVTPADGGAVLRQTVDPKWLAAPGRRFPVQVDPTTTLGPAGITDCYLNSGSATTSFCNSNVLEVGYGTAADSSIRRAVTKFDLSALTPSATVRTAKLTLTKTATAGPTSTTTANFPVQLRALTQPYTTAATWNTRDGSNNWTIAGGTVSPTVYDTRTANGGTAKLDLFPAQLVREWVDGTTPNHGLLLKADQESTKTGYVQYGSTRNTTTANRPVMTITWQDQLGTAPNQTTVSKKLGDKCDVSVAVTNGNLMSSCTEFKITGAGQPLEIKRYYNGRQNRQQQDNADGSLGRNRWQLSTGVSLQKLGSGEILYSDGTGMVWPYRPNGSGGFITPPGGNATLTLVAGSNPSRYELNFHGSNSTYGFVRANTDPANNWWQLVDTTDRNDNKMVFDYHPSKPGWPTQGALDKITDTRGRVLTVEWSSNATGFDVITGLIDSTGRRTTYSYNNEGSLTSATDTAGKTSSYDYADIASGYSRALVGITDGRGNKTTEIGYDTSGRVSTLTQHPDGSTSYASSFAYTETPSGTAKPSTVYTDERGNDTTYEYENKGYTSRVTKATDAYGHKQEKTYTPNAQVGSETNGLNGTIGYEYNANTTSTGPNDGESRTKSTSPTGSATNTAYTASQCPDSTKSTGGDAYQAKCSTDSAGRTGYSSYNGAGNSETNENGEAATAKVTRATESADAPTDGRVLKATDPEGKETNYTYSDLPNCTNGGGRSCKQLDTIVPPTGSGLGTRSFDLDNLDRIVKSTTGRAIETTSEYDGLDRLTKQTFSDNSPQLENSYDGNGNLVDQAKGTLADPNRKAQSLAYDWLNRLTQKTLPDGRQLRYTYDAAGNLLTAAEATSPGVLTRTTGYGYDKVNNLIEMTEPSGQKTVFRYNNDNKRTDTWYTATGYTTNTANFQAVSTPSGFAAHTKNTLDKNNRITRTTTSRASNDTTKVADISYCYASWSSGMTACPAPDANGSWGTADRGQRQWSKNELNGKITVYSYSTASRLLTADDPNAANTDYTFAYDPNGNLTRTSAGTTDTWWGHNTGNQACWKQTGTNPSNLQNCSPVPAGAQTGRKYDLSGNQEKAPGSGLNAAYNGPDQMTSVYTGGGYTSHTYDYATTDQVQRLSDTRYDDGNLADTITFANGQLGVQNTSGTLGVEQTYNRDPKGGLVSMTRYYTGSVTDRYFYVFDGLGNVIGLINGAGTERARYAYDPYGNSTLNQGVNGGLPENPYRYKGEYLDRTTGYYKMGMRYYDPTQGRWTQQDIIDEIGDPQNASRYAAFADDPINASDPTGMYCISVGVLFYSGGYCEDTGTGEESWYAGYGRGADVGLSLNGQYPSEGESFNCTIATPVGGWSGSWSEDGYSGTLAVGLEAGCSAGISGYF